MLRLRTAWRRAAPLLALLGCVATFGLVLPRPGLYATKLLLLLGAGIAARAIWAETGRTARIVTRFMAALEHRDFQQSFRLIGQGRDMEALGHALDRTVTGLRAERADGQAERRFAAALADEAPTPLLAIDPAGQVHLANKAARRLFGANDGRTVEAFVPFGHGFADALATVVPGGRADVRVRWNGLDQRAVIAAATAERDGRPWRILSVNIIQRELETAELATQADLVRVLTHEIMNSLTPVTSLAGSAASLMDRAEAGDAEALEDAAAAVTALARRAAGLAHFVKTYREFGRSPTVTKTRFEARPWANELARSFSATPQGEGVPLALSIEPERLGIDGDAGLLGQVMLNLLKNGAEAARAHIATPRLSLAVWLDEDGRTRLQVADNGAGVPADRRDEIFLPFFTTKRTGTGVGLSFARQVILLHGGAIGVLAAEGGGALFEIVL
jgi:nitrogen fixation/metabolism regulation signal transduction histidine kinase